MSHAERRKMEKGKAGQGNSVKRVNVLFRISFLEKATNHGARCTLTVLNSDATKRSDLIMSSMLFSFCTLYPRISTETIDNLGFDLWCQLHMLSVYI